MSFQKIQVPAQGEVIRINADKSLHVPNNPIIPFIEGDGIGVDVTPAMRRVVDAAVLKAYGNEKKISWMEVYAGEKATQVNGVNLRIVAWISLRSIQTNMTFPSYDSIPLDWAKAQPTDSPMA